VPPSDALVTNTTVTATVQAGDDTWLGWEAEQTGQVRVQYRVFLPVVLR
jgi:hypothetical protein